MKIFHFDFNTVFFERAYLENFILNLKEWGYDTLLWELEDFVRWDNLKYCFQEDSISKNEMAEILAFAESNGFENIPLLQCLGHCEYVLVRPEYAHLADTPGSSAPYCPCKQEVLDLLTALLNEYMEIFANSKYIHLGCDEVWNLGDNCAECQKIIADGGKEKLLAKHINFLNGIVRKNGRKSIIWADMLLIHPQATDLVEKNIVIADWRYELRLDRSKLWMWDEKGGRLIEESEITGLMRKNFSKYLYKNNKINIFYTTDFLLDNGFEVITAGASASYPDNYILGKTVDHICNSCSMMHKSSECLGYLQTSWTVHYFDYEMQIAIEMVQDEHDFSKVMNAYALKHFGIDGERFFALLRMLEGRVLFSFAGSTGHGKGQKEPPANIINIHLKEYAEAGILEDELEKTCKFYPEYIAALEGLKKLRSEVKSEIELFDRYILAAETLKNRAEFGILAASLYLNKKHNIDIAKLKDEIQRLAEEYRSVSLKRMTPLHAERAVRIIFGTLLEYLESQKV